MLGQSMACCFFQKKYIEQEDEDDDHKKEHARVDYDIFVYVGRYPRRVFDLGEERVR
jgi:hypothetical protein